MIAICIDDEIISQLLILQVKDIYFYTIANNSLCNETPTQSVTRILMRF